MEGLHLNRKLNRDQVSSGPASSSTGARIHGCRPKCRRPSSLLTERVECRHDCPLIPVSSTGQALTVLIRNAAKAHLLRGRLEPCITVPVLTLKSLRQSRQRKGCGLRVGRSWTLTDPHAGQAIPLGQRAAMNSCSTAVSSENRLAASNSVIPLRWCIPGAFCAMSYPTFLG